MDDNYVLVLVLPGWMDLWELEFLRIYLQKYVEEKRKIIIRTVKGSIYLFERKKNPTYEISTKCDDDSLKRFFKI